MGALTSRQNAGVEEVDIGVNHAYRYPPKSGNYFSSHFIMGGERFDTAQPEMYLFGENMDVNFLGSRPAPFPYPAPTANEPSKTLKALINIRKESLRFVRAPDDSSALKESQEAPPAPGPNPPAPSSTRFNIEFTFDCDVRCAITIMYFCSEEVTTSGMMYTPRDPSKNSETYHYKRGASQQFSQVCHVFDPSIYPEEELLYSFDRDILPIVIYCVAEEGEEPRQSHATFAVVEKHSDGYALKPLKQKLFVDGLSYLLQEIYGIENKNAENCKVSTEEDAEDNGAECVICMCDLRDTLILPCRHLCLCNCCADSLRYQANNCPICRAPFRALLQIKALQKVATNCTNPQANTEQSIEGIPAGYEAVSLIEALNGPSASPPPQPSAPPALDLYVQLPQSPAEGPKPPSAPPIENLHRSQPGHPLRGETARCFVESVTVRPGQVEDSTTQTDHHSNTPGHTRPSSPAPHEMRMSVLLAQECEEVCGITKLDEDAAASPPPTQARRRTGRKRSRDHHQTRDTVKVVNEIAQPRSLEVVDPSETRSLLDEDPLEGESGATERGTKRGATASGRDVLDQSPPSPPPPLPTAATPPLRPQQVEEEQTIEEEEEEEEEDNEDNEEEDMKSVIVVTGSTVTESTEAEDEHDPHQMSPSPVITPRKAQSGMSRAGGEEMSAPSSPGGGGSSVGLNLTHQSEPLSLPGTPLSNTSAISRSSDASVSSASSTRALLSHPTDVLSSSIV